MVVLNMEGPPHCMGCGATMERDDTGEAWACPHCGSTWREHVEITPLPDGDSDLIERADEAMRRGLMRIVWDEDEDVYRVTAFEGDLDLTMPTLFGALTATLGKRKGG